MKNRKKRSESFWGIHCDFHAKPEEGLVIGDTLREEDIRELCEKLNPDFIQIDCKGHPGWTSYPSKKGNAMPNFKFDNLELWRRITKEYGVALYMHFSGVVDVKYCKEHPEERTLLADGNLCDSIRLDGKYLDEYFIPQISELVENYDIDGIWVDGECWAVAPDYHTETIEKFEKATGIKLDGKAPRSHDDPYYVEYLDYTREMYRKYLRHYVDVLHEKFPELQICSNWAFSDHMPEEICVDVDFLSGDLNPLNCVNSARYAARMLAGQGISWDLMSWNFRFKIFGAPLIPAKRPIQIMQEAAAVILMGGAFQNNISMRRDGSPDMHHLRKLVPVMEFVKAREEFCFGGKNIHQAAMLVPTYDRYKEVKMPFSRHGMDKFMGLTTLLCDSGQSLELVGEHNLRDKVNEYPLIIVPELYEGCDASTVELLRNYVLDSGSLLIVGNVSGRFFANQNFPFSAEPYKAIPDIPNYASYSTGHNLGALGKTMPHYFTIDGDEFGLVNDACRVDSDNGETVAFLHCSFYDEGVPLARVMGYGKGKLGIIGADIGTQYLHGMQCIHRSLVNTVIGKMYDPLARVEKANGLLEINCLEKNGKLMLQLFNAGGEHRNAVSITEDFIPSVTDITVSVKCENIPSAVLIHPQEKNADFEYKDGRAYISVDKVDIHSIIEIK